MQHPLSKIRFLAFGAFSLWLSAQPSLLGAQHQTKRGEIKTIAQSDRRVVRLGSSSAIEQHNEHNYSLLSGTALFDHRRKLGSRAMKVSLRNHQVSIGEGTCMVEYQEGGYVKVVCLSGRVSLRTTSLLGEFIELKAGHMAIFNPVEPILPVAVEINLERFLRSSHILTASGQKLANQNGVDLAVSKQNKSLLKGDAQATALVIKGRGTAVRVERQGTPQRASGVSAPKENAESEANSNESSSDGSTNVGDTMSSFQATSASVTSTLNTTSFNTALSGALHLLGIPPFASLVGQAEREVTRPIRPPVVDSGKPGGDTGGNGSGGNPGGGGSGSNSGGDSGGNHGGGDHGEGHGDGPPGIYEMTSDSIVHSSGLLTELADRKSLRLSSFNVPLEEAVGMNKRLTFKGNNDFSPLGALTTLYSTYEDTGITFGSVLGSLTHYTYGTGSTIFTHGATLNLLATHDITFRRARLTLGHGTASHLRVISEKGAVDLSLATVEASNIQLQAPVVLLSDSELRSSSLYQGEIQIVGLSSTSNGSLPPQGKSNTLKIEKTKIGNVGTPKSIEVSATDRPIEISNSSQLKALAKISLETQNSGQLRVYNSSLTVTEPQGEIDIRAMSDIHLHDVHMQADIIKASALGTNGWLHIQGGTFNANQLIQFFANGSGGKISFSGRQVNLNSPITHLKAATVEVDRGTSVNVSGDAYIEATHHRYNMHNKGSIHTGGNLHRDIAPPP